MNLSIFPLKNCLFPGGVLSLMIFEIRYLKMIKKVNDEKSCFGIVLLKSGSETDKPGATEQFYDVGTRAKIIQLEVLQPTLFSIKVKGEGRFKIESANKGKYSLWNAVVSEIQDDDIVQLPKEVERLSHKLKEVLYLNKNKMLIILTIIFYLIFKNFKIMMRRKNLIQIGCFSYLMTVFIPFLPGGSFFADFNSNFFWLNFSLYYASNYETNIFK